MRDGQLESLTESSSSQGRSGLDINVEGEAGTTVAALIIAGCAICLVAIAIILLLVFIVVRNRSGSLKIENKEEEDIINEYRRRQSQMSMNRSQNSQQRSERILVPDDGRFP